MFFRIIRKIGRNFWGNRNLIRGIELNLNILLGIEKEIGFKSYFKVWGNMC